VRAALFLAAAAILARPALAQEVPRWEIGGFGGGFFGSRLSLTPDADVRLFNGSAFGLRGGLALDRHFRLEGSFSRANTKVAALDPATGAPLTAGRPAHVTTYELDALYGFGSRRLRGYLGLGAGAMTLPLPVGLGSDTRFAANVAIGGEYFFNERFGLRVDGRYRWRASDRRLGATICESEGCFPFTTDLFSSAEASAGVTYRFGALLPDSTSEGDAGEPRRFATAALELAALEIGPFALNKWVSKDDFAQVTRSTILANFRSGFTYDRDGFWTNEWEHAYNGDFYFNAGRSNGYGFWESAAFAFVGSYIWECCTEIEPPAINDLVNTTLGGMQTGEIAHRLSRMLVDNTASGSSRLWRELAALVVNPVDGLNRFLRGDMTRDAPNPEDRLPSRFRLDYDVGYRHIGGPAVNPDQAILTASALYGDPFEGEILKPFDSFSLSFDASVPATAKLARVEERGILRGWELGDPGAGARQILGVFMGYQYVNNEEETFGTESLSVGLLSRYRLGADLLAETDLAASLFPLAAFRTTDTINPLSGRNYDYAPGGGVRIEGTLRRAGRSLAAIAYAVAWSGPTLDGVSKSNTFQFFRASAFLPLGEHTSLGSTYSWYSRDSRYDSFGPQRRSQSEWRVFLSRSL
jgi:hypothetical protein